MCTFSQILYRTTHSLFSLYDIFLLLTGESGTEGLYSRESFFRKFGRIVTAKDTEWMRARGRFKCKTTGSRLESYTWNHSCRNVVQWLGSDYTFVHQRETRYDIIHWPPGYFSKRVSSIGKEPLNLLTDVPRSDFRPSDQWHYWLNNVITTPTFPSLFKLSVNHPFTLFYTSDYCAPQVLLFQFLLGSCRPGLLTPPLSYDSWSRPPSPHARKKKTEDPLPWPFLRPPILTWTTCLKVSK